MQLDWYARGSEPLVYALGNRGAEVLAAKGELRRGGVRWDTKNRNLSRLFLSHTLMVAEIMAAFEVACRSREGVRLIPPEELLAGAPAETPRLRLPFRWQVEVLEGGKPYRLGVEPDRVFGLEFKGAEKHRRREYFFLEADRGTMPVVRRGLAQTSIFRKLLAYQETWRQNIHKRHLGIPNFRVLTVTTSRERMSHLIAASRLLSGGGARLFLFGGQVTFNEENILDLEWVTGKGDSISIAKAQTRSEQHSWRKLGH